MSEASSHSADSALPIERLPKTALQALYHAVTGKTENFSKTLSNNVIITYHSIEQLYHCIRQQIDHYDVMADPTVTIIVKDKDSKILQYSSWERFQSFSVNTPDITSELIIKFEFIIQLSNTPSPQRCIINVSLDSGLPIVIVKEDNRPPDLFIIEFFSDFASKYQTVIISIDFVDFLIAKIFCGVVEGWFLTLETVPKSKLAVFLLTKYNVIRSITAQFGRIGSAAFLAGYIWFNSGFIGSLGKLVYAISTSLVLWSLIAVLTTSLTKAFAGRIIHNIVPSVILLTDADTRAYESIKRRLNSSRITLSAIAGAAILNIGLNLIASYIYTLLAKP